MFEDRFVEALKKYPEMLQDKRMFSSYMSDLFSEDKMKMHLLVVLYQLGITEELQEITEVDSAFAYRYVKNLMDSQGTSRENADWAVKAWSLCYGERILNKRVDVLQWKNKRNKALEFKTDIGTRQYQDLFTCYGTGNEYTITGITENTMKMVVVPGKIHTMKIKKIGENAFADMEITETVISDGITEIGFQAYQNCQNLRQAILPNTMKRLGDRSFCGCNALKTINLPEGLEELGEEVFAESGIKAMTLPKNVLGMGKGLFRRCEFLESVQLPERMYEITPEMFRECSRLKKIELPKTLRAIGEKAFAGCIMLKDIYIPENVDSISDTAFVDMADDFQILCEMGSYAEQYARQRKIRYQLF